MTAARLGVATVDAGMAALVLHSAHEPGGADYPKYFILGR